MRADRIPARLQRQVASRAGDRCEYCGLAQLGQEATFHIDHITPIAAGGRTALANLALACVTCSLRKAARVIAIDPLTGQSTPLYNPRSQRHSDHFTWYGTLVTGVTMTGRATVDALGMNRGHTVIARLAQAALGRYPPPDDWSTREPDLSENEDE
jgi:hypothetical protein